MQLGLFDDIAPKEKPAKGWRWPYCIHGRLIFTQPCPACARCEGVWK